MDKIICGGFEWERNPQLEDNRLDGGNVFLANAIVGDELAIDTMSAEIFSLRKVPIIFAPADADRVITKDEYVFCCRYSQSDITDIPYGTPVEYYRGDALLARMYKSDIVREGKSVFRLSAVSAIGLLNKAHHMGGIYTGQTAGTILVDIIGDLFSYTVDSDVSSVPVYGWLPAATRRSNLQQLLFAIGASVLKNGDGTVRFTFLSSASPTQIVSDRVYVGGSVLYDSPATGVDVTEHALFALDTDRSDTLFDNTDGSGAVDHQTVLFDEPCHDLVASGNLAIHESGVNYAVVSGTGTLTGKKYTHQKKVISKRVQTSGSENVLRVTAATLVSAVNSLSVAKRILAYYSSAKKVTAGIVAGEERPGSAVTLEDSFGDRTTGILESMDITISGTLKADAKIVTGYVPAGGGNSFSHAVVLSGDVTSWTVPDGVTSILAAIIQGGSGGQSGAAGESTPAGESASESHTAGGTQYYKIAYPSVGGTGGESGTGGAQGKILRVDLDVTPGQVFSISSGAGGIGGAYSADGQVNGTQGGETTFGSYSSANGAIPENGFLDLFSGNIYALPGHHGVDGGDGTGWNEDESDRNGIKAGNNVIGPDGTVYSVGESPCTPASSELENSFTKNGTEYAGDVSGYAYQGRGGGAAVGANGESGGATGGQINLYFQQSPFNIGCQVISKVPGKGADAAVVPPVPRNIGTGGGGGHGGGGAGGGGRAEASIFDGSDSVYAACSVFSATMGTSAGGKGSNGADGAPGGVIIYY